MGFVLAGLILGASAPAASAEDKRDLLVLSSTTLASPWSLGIIGPTGAPVRTVNPVISGCSSGVSWSPDEREVAYCDNGRLVVQDATGGPSHILPVTGALVAGPYWSPVSDEIAYAATSPAPARTSMIRAIDADGTNDRLIAAAPVNDDSLSWSPDGSRLAFVSSHDDQSIGREIVSVPATGGAPTTTMSDANLLRHPAFSPDGTRIAFVRSEPSAGEGHAPTPLYSLVVRDLASGNQTVLASGPPGEPVPLRQPTWSADSERIAYGESSGLRVTDHDRVYSVSSTDGSDPRILFSTPGFVHAISWANARRRPNYYVKHIEVAQAIAPDLPPLDGAVPLSADPIAFHWHVPAVAGSTIPLVAGKSTLVRIYVGDASLRAGESEEHFLRFRVTGPGLATPREGLENVRVTAPDVAPGQPDRIAALNVWLPSSVAVSGSAVRLDVEVNMDERLPECGGCYPKGNKAFLDGILFEDGGKVIVAPVPIFVIAPGRAVVKPREEDFAKLWPTLTPMLPVGDTSVGSVASPTILAVAFNDLIPGRLESLDPAVRALYACDVLLARLEELRLISPPASLASGAQRWVGITSHPLPGAQCEGIAFRPGRSIVLTAPNTAAAVHELGHSLGLNHTLGYGDDAKAVAEGAIALPYIGIGGAGYQSYGGVLETLNKLSYGDVMSYSLHRWTSPFTWNRMFEAILAESGATASASASAAGRPPALRMTARAMRSRRLVSGVLAGGKGVILRSLVADSAQPTRDGTVIGTIVARDRHGRRVATTKIRGNPAASPQHPAPFVVALPNRKRITSLALLPDRAGKPLARLKASRHAPKAHLIRVRRRASATKPLKIRWRASDRDRDKPTVILRAKRGKSPWKTIAMGPARFTTTIAPRTLGKGKRLKLRLLVSDGFNTTAITARLHLIKRSG